jgi:YfiH family protein
LNPPDAPHTVLEVAVPGNVPRYEHPNWTERFPWLMQGITARGGGAEPCDMALFGRSAVGAVLTRWEALGRDTGTPRWVHGRQVHGSTVRLHEAGPPGLHVSPACDGHVSGAPGVLLTVGLADCVGVSVVDPARRAVALLHSGWRGAAAGILERGLQVLRERLDSHAEDVHVHLGPAICGECYEVGPEVHAALGLPVPASNQPVDLRKVLAARARAAGVPAAHITTSAHCTKCGDSPFFSHRGGHAERHQSYLGIR